MKAIIKNKIVRTLLEGITGFFTGLFFIVAVLVIISWPDVAQIIGIIALVSIPIFLALIIEDDKNKKGGN